MLFYDAPLTMVDIDEASKTFKSLGINSGNSYFGVTLFAKKE